MMVRSIESLRGTPQSAQRVQKLAELTEQGKITWTVTPSGWNAQAWYQGYEIKVNYRERQANNSEALEVFVRGKDYASVMLYSESSVYKGIGEKLYDLIVQSSKGELAAAEFDNMLEGI